MPINFEGKKSELEHKFCSFAKLQLKETKEDFHVSGYVATSHPDNAVSEDGKYVGDIIPKGTLQKIATDINNKYKPQAGAVSERHDYLKAEDLDMPIAGVIAPDTTATLHHLTDGEWGVHVDTVLSKTNPRFEEVKTNIEQGVYPGFSIEYDNTEFVPTEKEGKTYRLLTNLDTEGFGYAHRRKIANPHAEYTDFGYKELSAISTIKNKQNKVIKLEEKEIKEKAQKIIDEMEGKERKEIEAKLIEAEIPETVIKELLPAEGEGEGEGTPPPTDPPATPPTEPTEPEGKEVKEHKVNAKDFALLKKFREEEERGTKMKEITESKEFKEMVKEEVKEIQTKNSPLFNPEDKEVKFKELDDYRASLAEIKELDKPMKSTAERQSRFQRTIERQYKEAGKLCDALMTKGVDVHANFRNMTPVYPLSEIKEGMSHPYEMETYGSRIQMKELSRIEMKAGEGAQVDTNIVTGWTYGSYYLSPVELNDIFQPVLVNQLNDQTTTFGRLKKEDWSGRSQIQFRARTGTNSTVGGYSEGANLTYGTDFTGTVGRQKFQQPFCYYRVLVAVTGQAQRFAMAPGGMGDRWADEIKWSGQDLLSRDGTSGTAATGLNRAILGSGAGTAENIALGFEGLILGTTGTLYGKALASFATLRSHTETLSTENISLEQLRKMIRRVIIGTGTGSSQIHSNSRAADLVFFTHHLQIDFVKAIYQDLQRIVPTSGRVGFEGELEIDGVPMVGDRMITNTDVFLINTANTKIAMNLPPTIEPLPVTADAQAAHIKTYWNLYSDAPGNNYFCDGFATS